MTTDTNNRPSHYVYAVCKGSQGGKAFWTRIGAAWVHIPVMVIADSV